MREKGPSRRAIVLAGGFGTRLREFARSHGHTEPKQFCSFGRERSLLQETLRRIGPLVPDRRTTVVVHASQQRCARRQVAAMGAAELFVQPADRGTGTAALYPALRARPDDILLITPADHAVRDEEAFRVGLRAAAEAVERNQADTVLLGVPASAARTDFGWIRCGSGLAPAVRRVRAFVEKPRRDIAHALYAERALWNTMVMVTRARSLVAQFRLVRPALVALLRAAAAMPSPMRRLAVRSAYRRVGPLDLSRDVLQANPERLAVAPCPAECGWDDLGTPERLAAWLEPERTSS